jgi:O-methyltransferase involved in polyketide biosynthesis
MPLSFIFTQMMIKATNLTGVCETLLMTLFCRAQETQRPEAIIRDEAAVRLVHQIEHDFSKFEDWKIQWGVAVRTQLIDAAVEQFLGRFPDAIIVTLGAGLCTRFFRFDNGRACWFSIDLPPVTPLWNALIGPSERNQFVTASVTDSTWVEIIQTVLKDRSAEHILFIVEGLFMYLPEAEVKQAVFTLQKEFPGCEMVVEVLGNLMIRNPQLNRPVASTGARFIWGASDCSVLETWSPGIKLLNQWFYADYHRDRQGWLQLLSYIPGLKQQLGKVGYFSLG